MIEECDGSAWVAVSPSVGASQNSACPPANDCIHATISLDLAFRQRRFGQSHGDGSITEAAEPGGRRVSDGARDIV
jgi:hypothetical protein